MDKATTIKKICEYLLADDKQYGADLANDNYPFKYHEIQKRQYSKYQMCRVFLRDGFIDRYSGDKLLFPGLIRLMTFEYPDIFRYHKNWKMSNTHMIYWELMPTIDHLIPVARGGQDIESNWITTSMTRNSAKANWVLDEIGWSLHDKGSLKDWDGLAGYFINLINKNPDYENDDYIKQWKNAIIKVSIDYQIDITPATTARIL